MLSFQPAATTFAPVRKDFIRIVAIALVAYFSTAVAIAVHVLEHGVLAVGITAVLLAVSVVFTRLATLVDALIVGLAVAYPRSLIQLMLLLSKC